MRAKRPVLLSLPVTDAMEAQLLHQETLDSKLTEYRPDDLDGGVPKAQACSGAHDAVEYNSSEQAPPIARCSACLEEPGPCQECQTRFNRSVARTLDALTRERQHDDVSARPDPRAFRLEVIGDDPLPSDFAVPEYDAVFCDPDDDVPVAQLPGFDPIKVVACDDPQAARSHAPTDCAPATQTPARPSARPARVCWWHLRPFPGRPVSLPLRRRGELGLYDGLGEFCSFECAYAYRLEHRSARVAPIELLYEVYRDAGFTGALVPAWPREVINAFHMNVDPVVPAESRSVWPVDALAPFVRACVAVEPLQGQAAHPSPENTTGLVRYRKKPHPNALNRLQSVSARRNTRPK